MEVLEIVLETVLRVLRDPLWQGVGVIIGLLLTLAQIFPERAKVFVPASAVILIMGFIAHFFAGGTPVQPTVNSLPRTPNLPTPIGQNTPMWFVTSPVLTATPLVPDPSIFYFQRPWSNNTGRVFLRIEKVILESNVVTFSFELVNTKGSSLNFDQGVSCDGSSTTCMYVSDETGRKYFVQAKGGDLFDGNRIISVPAGSSKSGWVRYNLSNDTRNYISLHRSAEDNTGRNTIYINYREFRCQLQPLYCYELP
jgi:hypothetical protein